MRHAIKRGLDIVLSAGLLFVGFPALSARRCSNQAFFAWAHLVCTGTNWSE